MANALTISAWLVAAALAAGGCLQSTPDDDGGNGPPTADLSWSERALTSGGDHDHANPSHHEGFTTPNIEIIGHDPMVSPDRGTTNYYFPCGDAKATADDRRLAIVESGNDVAFAIADVTDPTKPVMLGELIMRTTDLYDVGLVPDGRHVVAVSELPRTPDDQGEPFWDTGLAWRSPCNPEPVPIMAPRAVLEDVLPRPNHLLLISIDDPTAPVVIDQRPLTGVGHSVYSTVIDGRTWVAVGAWASINGLSNYQFYEIATTPAGPVLEYLSTFNFPPTTDIDSFTRNMGHNDVWIVEHPGTGQTLAWMAHWHHGMMIVDLSDPMSPTLIGHWNDYDPARPGSTGGFHSLYVFPELWDDRHFVITGPELGSHPPDQPTGTVNVLDTTDPTSPTQVAAWTLPHDVEWTRGAEWSGHYLTVMDRTGLISMYHGGIWAFDLRPILTNDFTSLESVGVFVPTLLSPAPDPTASPWYPMVGEVHAFEDGTLLTFEASSGVYTFRFDESYPIVPPEPWPLEPAPGG